MGTHDAASSDPGCGSHLFVEELGHAAIKVVDPLVGLRCRTRQVLLGLLAFAILERLLGGLQVQSNPDRPVDAVMREPEEGLVMLARGAQLARERDRVVERPLKLGDHLLGVS